MNKKLWLATLAACLVSATSTAIAAEPMVLNQENFTDLQHAFQLMLPGVRQSMVLTEDTLSLINQHTDLNKITHVRMQQEYAGFPVFGGYAIMHSIKPMHSLLAAKNTVKMNGVVYQRIGVELGQPEPLFVERGAIALQTFKQPYEQYTIPEEQVTPIVYIDKKNQAFWAYKVSILVQHDDSIPERPTAIVDAKTLKPFVQWNDLKTARSTIKGMGFGGNNRTGLYQYGKDFPLLTISRDSRTAYCLMENEDVRVVDMGHKYNGLAEPMRFSCRKSADQSKDAYWTGYKGNGYDQQNGAFSPSNDALYAGEVIKHMYKDWYGVQVLTSNGRQLKLVMRVHYGQGYENAYWDDKQMTFGDGASMMYPLVSLGVGAHEVSHGFTEQHANLNYYGESGGMNEAFSDMAAQVAEYYSKGKNSWSIGAEIMKEGSGYEALRFMDKPSRDGYSIDSADEYIDGLDVHYSSGVYNRMYYLLATQPDWTPRKAFQVMIKANMDYWTPYSTFVDGGCGVISAANDLGFSVDAVKVALKQVAIDDDSCNNDKT